MRYEIFDRESSSKVKLECYIINSPEEIIKNPIRPAVLIIAGGGYGHVASRERECIALKFMAQGYHAFLLTYSVAEAPLEDKPLLDCSWAMSLIRKSAEEWQLDPDKIAVCGFSAGGHLAASLGVFWNSSAAAEKLQVKSEEIKPNALVLSYPVITSGEYTHRGSFDNLFGKDANEEVRERMSLEKHMNKDIPPTFIWHTLSDTVVPVQNTFLFAEGLIKNNISFEMHIFPEGPHGISLATTETATETHPKDEHIAQWFNLCVQWLNNLFNYA